ncbi:MAG: hypothetical protein O7E52_05050, partial [Candidatus Poribacteria bacterium]|nr:hypothetical protein [Candidatus Poribacteria bacterium]
LIAWFSFSACTGQSTETGANMPDEIRVVPYDPECPDLFHRLARKYRDDRPGYTDAKGPFIWEIMAKATQWSQMVGWEPGPSDA